MTETDLKIDSDAWNDAGVGFPSEGDYLLYKEYCDVIMLIDADASTWSETIMFVIIIAERHLCYRR